MKWDRGSNLLDPEPHGQLVPLAAAARKQLRRSGVRANRLEVLKVKRNAAKGGSRNGPQDLKLRIFFLRKGPAGGDATAQMARPAGGNGC